VKGWFSRSDPFGYWLYKQARPGESRTRASPAALHVLCEFALRESKLKSSLIFIIRAGSQRGEEECGIKPT